MNDELIEMGLTADTGTGSEDPCDLRVHMNVEIALLCQPSAALFEYLIDPVLKGLADQRVDQIGDILPMQHLNLILHDRKCLINFAILSSPHQQIYSTEMFELWDVNMFHISTLHQLPLPRHDVSKVPDRHGLVAVQEGSHLLSQEAINLRLALGHRSELGRSHLDQSFCCIRDAVLRCHYVALILV